MSDHDFDAANAEAVRVALDPNSFPEQKLQTYPEQKLQAYFPLLGLVLDTNGRPAPGQATSRRWRGGCCDWPKA